MQGDVRSRFPLSPHWLWQLRRRYFSVNPMSEVIWDISEPRAVGAGVLGMLVGLVKSALLYGAALLILVVWLDPDRLTAILRIDERLLAVFAPFLILMWTRNISMRLGNLHSQRMTSRRDHLLQLAATPSGAGDWCAAMPAFVAGLTLPWIIAFLSIAWIVWLTRVGLEWEGMTYLALVTGASVHLALRLPCIGMEINLRHAGALPGIEGVRLLATLWIIALIVPGVFEVVRGHGLDRAVPFLGAATAIVHSLVEWRHRAIQGRIPQHIQAWADAEWEKSRG